MNALLRRCVLAAPLLFIALAASAGSPETVGRRANRGPARQIDLPTALRLAGASNLDVQIAAQRLAEAQANELTAVQQFFPVISPSLGYRRHEGNVQTVEGRIIDADKELYSAGANLAAQLDLGESLFRALAAQQLVQAAGHAADAQQHESVYQAAVAYLELVRAHAASRVGVESVRIAEDYAGQVGQAVEAGLAFKGDSFRATTQVERNRVALGQAREQLRLAASRLAQVLHLDPAVNLLPPDGDLVPVHLVRADQPLDALVAQAFAARPELRQFGAQLEAAKKVRAAAVYGPLVPTVGGQVFYGGLGGGIGSPGARDFDESADYSATLSWRVGPGGLLDFGRIRASEARLRVSELELEKLRDEVTRQVVDGSTRINSLAGQMRDGRRALEAAEQTLRLTRGRRQFGVGEVLENIQAEQDLTRTRVDYLNIISEHNKAQYALERALGAFAGPAPSARKHPTPK